VSFFFPHFFRRRFVEKGIMGSFVVPCVLKPEAGFKSRSPSYYNNMLEGSERRKEFVSLLKIKTLQYIFF